MITILYILLYDILAWEPSSAWTLSFPNKGQITQLRIETKPKHIVPQSKLEANRSRGSRIIIGHKIFSNDENCVYC